MARSSLQFERTVDLPHNVSLKPSAGKMVGRHDPRRARTVMPPIGSVTSGSIVDRGGQVLRWRTAVALGIS
jgi:hypothetical protein